MSMSDEKMKMVLEKCEKLCLVLMTELLGVLLLLELASVLDWLVWMAI